jgi:methyl-accepting chemotaxis protein
MVMTINNAADNISRVEGFIGEIQQITKQTNMLAMNTQIEAAKAGEQGKSFRIIAEEVKNLSHHIRGLSDEMQAEIMQVSGSIRESSAAIDELANYDMTQNMMLKDKIDNLIDSIMKQNYKYADMLGESIEASKRTANSINGLIVGIQFQDRASQVINDFNSIITEAIETLRINNPEIMHNVNRGEACEDIAAKVVALLKLSEVRNKFVYELNEMGILNSRANLVTNYAEKSKTIFSGGINDVMAMMSGGGAASGNIEDDDDIDLF